VPVPGEIVVVVVVGLAVVLSLRILGGPSGRRVGGRRPARFASLAWGAGNNASIGCRAPDPRRELVGSTPTRRPYVARPPA